MKLTNILKELVTNKEIICDNCGWRWKIKDGGDDLYICHKCRHDNTPEQLKEIDCWDGYKLGNPKTKISSKTGKRVNNCIPIKEEETPELQFPNGFQPAKSVPKGGAMCANCAKWNEKTQLCEGQYYIDWNGNGEIPAEPTEYVCIWWVDERK